MNMTPSGGKTIDPFGGGCDQEPARRAFPPGNGDSSEHDGFSRLGPQARFETTSMRLDDLLHHIAQNLLALPAFARPFLWSGRETARLLDSLFNGYPVGVCIVWEYRPPTMYRAIGRDFCRRAPALLLADGRQRLTALYCALRGVLPAAEGQAASRIQVAFSPMRAAFTPAGTKTRDNPEYIPDIAGLWETPSSSRKIAQAYLSRLGRAMRLNEKGLEQVGLNIDRLLDMLHYCFPVLELPASVSENEVRAIFSRINHSARPDPRPSRHTPALNPAGPPANPANPIGPVGQIGPAKTPWPRPGDEPRLIVKNSAPTGRAWFPPRQPDPADNSTAHDPPLREKDSLGDHPTFPARSFVAL
jgi:hypothetical protein